MSEVAPSLCVGVATRNRPQALLRCLRSLRLLQGMLAEVVVVDDGSDAPVEGPVRAALGAEAPPGLRFVRHPRSLNVAAARNRIAREASTPWLLNLDDDAFIVSAQAVREAMAVLERDPGVGAVAFAQGDELGVAYPPEAQGDPAREPCYIPAFVGFAELLRREAFLAVGGFSERMGINGEEKDCCLRLLDAGYRVVYLPGAVVGHVADQAGRDPRRYLHQTVRNTALGALYSEPFPLVLGGVALRLWRYFPMRRGWAVHDPGGFGRILGGLLKELPGVLRERRPVRWSTLRRWRQMTSAPPEPYPSSGAAAADGEAGR
jgi:GT2 family glycosyltransferase